MTLTTFVIAWITLGCTVLILAGYRKMVARSEDDNIHIRANESARVLEQAAVAGRLEAVDRWGKILTVIAFISGLILASAYLYQKWFESNQIIH